MALLIKNGEIITPGERYVADIYCENEKITRIGPGLTAEPGTVEIDARGKISLAVIEDESESAETVESQATVAAEETTAE